MAKRKPPVPRKPPLARQLAEITANLIFRKEERQKLVRPLTALYQTILKKSDDEEKEKIRKELDRIQGRRFRTPPALLTQILDSVGRQGLVRWVIGKLPRSDQPAARRLAARWSLARDAEGRKVLAAIARFLIKRPKAHDELVIARLFAEIAKKENTMPNNYTFDPRGLPDFFNAAARQAWETALNGVPARPAAGGAPAVPAVPGLIESTFKLAQAGNEELYAGIKGVLLLNDQFTIFDPPLQPGGPPQVKVNFRDALRSAYDEVVTQAEVFVTPGVQDSNLRAYIAVAAAIPIVTGRAAAAAAAAAAGVAGAGGGAVAAAPPDVFYQELAYVTRFVIARSADVPLNDRNFLTQVQLGLNEYVAGGNVASSLQLPPLGTDAQITPDNVRAVGTLAGCAYVEKIRLIDVVDRITELFFNGMLPVGNDTAGRALHDYYWSREDRLRPNERMSVYSRVLGMPGGDISKEVQPNKEFDSLLNRFIASIAEYDRQRSVSGMFQNNNARPLTFLGEHVRKAGNDLARNATLYGHGGGQFAARMIADAVQQAVRILSLPQILRAYGVSSAYQVVERVVAGDWNQQVNVVKYKTMAEAVQDIHEIVARNAALWSSTAGQPLFDEFVNNQLIPGQLPVGDQQKLFTHSQYWLAVQGVQDQQVEKLSQPVESKAGASLPLLHPGASGGAGLDTITKLQQMVSSGSTPSLDQLKSLLPVGNA